MINKNKIVLISSYCDTDEKIEILNTNIDTLKNLGLDVMLNSPIQLPLETIKKCDYFFLTKDNPILEWPLKAVYVYSSYFINGKSVTMNRCFSDYGWANVYQIKKLSEFSLTYDYKYFYHIIYDLIIDDVAIDAFNSEEKLCNFYHFHEHNVCLHLMCFDREHLTKFLSCLTLDKYLELGGIAEQWLDRLLLENNFDYTIEDSYVDDKILFRGHNSLVNYSKIDGLIFFILKHAENLDNITLYFYNIPNDMEIKINDSIYYISNDYTIDLGYNKENIINTVIEYNGVKQNITQDIIDITHNTIVFN